ncbi:unnamed protein product [Pleuronectes platessa]|uniref:Uncharacterized protein n=1 Tax=Pleuronectes platessa TaxID=8262 RepID=A0A9N7TPR4_PLEPL|nr:unnamed protein product [Pleuronectes platessa]
MEKSSRPADSSVSGELMFQDWFDCMVEEFNPTEPQQMDGRGMDEAFTVLPGVCPPPHNLQASSPGTSVHPGLIIPGSRLSLENRSPAGYPQTTQWISDLGLLDFDLETADDDELAALFTVKDGETCVSEDASDTRSAQSSQKSQNPSVPQRPELQDQLWTLQL